MASGLPSARLFTADSSSAGFDLPAHRFIDAYWRHWSDSDGDIAAGVARYFHLFIESHQHTPTFRCCGYSLLQKRRWSVHNPWSDLFTDLACPLGDLFSNGDPFKRQSALFVSGLLAMVRQKYRFSAKSITRILLPRNRFHKPSPKIVP